MVDNKKLAPKADWYPMDQDAWERFVEPLQKYGPGDIGNLSLYVAPEEESAYDSGRVSGFFTSVIADNTWQRKVGEIDSLFKSFTTRSAEDVYRINVLRQMARTTPASSPYLFENVIKRDGFEDIRVPNLSALLVGGVPTVFVKAGAFGIVMERVADQWYAGDREKMAADIGIHTSLLSRLIEGEALPKSHSTIVKIAEGIGVDPDVLDVAWFADKNRKALLRLVSKPHSSANGRVRARIVNRLAAARLGESFMPSAKGQNILEKYIDLAVFAMRARIHPRTVIPVVASIDGQSEDLFSGAVPLAESLKDSWPWKAAILCYMAANHFESWGKIREVTQHVFMGNDYLLNGMRALPSFMDASQASDLRSYYMELGLKLDAHVKSNHMGTAPVVSGAQAEEVPAQGFSGIVRGGSPDYGIRMTPSRSEVLDEFKRDCPKLWGQIEHTGRYDIVGRALTLADPRGDESAVSFTAFAVAMRALADKEDIIPAGFDRNSTSADYIVNGATWTFGGTKMVKYDDKTWPVFKTHTGEEFISVNGEFITLSAIAMMAVPTKV